MDKWIIFAPSMAILSTKTVTNFRSNLLAWYVPDERPLPWKGIQNPYFIWLSEIILQQTRVAQGLPYYERFVSAYPRVEDLAAAPLDDVLRLWEGLGYYSRARNLHRAAQVVATEWNGQFPDTYEGLLSLPGVGPYTAAAIGSFAFGLPTAVVDGNVYRVLSRYLAWDTPIDSTAGKKAFAEAAQTLIDTLRPAEYNQAIMDFGATVCTPKQAACTKCPLKATCQACQQDRVYTLPVKAKKIQKRDRFFHYLILHAGDHYLLQQRTAGDIWEGLFEFPLLEHTSVELTEVVLRATPIFQELGADCSVRLRQKSAPQRHILTHQRILATFWHFELDELPKDVGVIATSGQLGDFAFPKLIRRYLDQPTSGQGLLF